MEKELDLQLQPSDNTKKQKQKGRVAPITKEKLNRRDYYRNQAQCDKGVKAVLYNFVAKTEQSVASAIRDEGGRLCTEYIATKSVQYIVSRNLISSLLKYVNDYCTDDESKAEAKKVIKKYLPAINVADTIQ